VAAESHALIELPCPFISEFGVIRFLADPGIAPSDLLQRLKSGDYGKPFVIDDGECSTLYFTLRFVQSVMRHDDPAALELAYTQRMMTALLFLPQPQHILMLGLGGGSLARFCLRHLPQADLTAVELNPEVIAFRHLFKLPEDGPRFRIIEADAAEYIASGIRTSDLIFVDAYDPFGAAPAVCSESFFAAARQALSGRGILVANLACERPELQLLLDRIDRVFAGNILTLPVRDDGNTIVFAFRDPRFEPRWRWIAGQAKAMRQRYGLDFPAFAEQLVRRRKSLNLLGD